MSIRLYAQVVAAAGFSLACNPVAAPHDPLDAAPRADATLPLCPQSAQVFGLDSGESRVMLTPGTALPVTQGFQGFLFVRVGLHSAGALPNAVQVSVAVQLDNGVEQYLPQRAVKTHLADDGADTVELPVFFNDSTMPDLIARKASVDVEVETASCVLRAHADVVLSLGGYMGADAGFWGAAAD